MKHSNSLYLLSFVETPRKFIIAELSIRKLGSSSVLIIRLFEIKLNKSQSLTSILYSPCKRTRNLFKQLVYEFGKISSEILFESVEVFIPTVLSKQTLEIHKTKQ